MTSKERVRAALNHCTPDLVPTDFAAVSDVWQRLLADLDCPDADTLLDRLGVDIRFVDPAYIGPALQSFAEPDGDTIDEHYFGWRARWHWNGRQRDYVVCHHPLAAAETVEEILAHRWPDPDWFDYEGFAERCRSLPEKSLLVGHAGVYQWGTFLRGPAQLFEDMAERPDIAQAIFDMCVEFELAFYERCLTAGNGAIDILRIYDDYGSQTGPLFSRDMWRAYFARNTRRLADLAHAHGAFFMQHSCGAVASLIPDLLDCGVDALDPLQNVAGMDIDVLKAEYGDRLTFHGGIDTQWLLPCGTPEQVREEVLRYIATLNRNGGYILCGSQDFQADVPTENILALYEAVNACP